ncbi:family 43 glycosylhydrolase [Sphingobacterium siyangense]|uniref:family 43 glycosylhydrolase n=1 Tax=Sphingobacterium siyangense TaxID=459529 RepID=UPI003C723E6D
MTLTFNNSKAQSTGNSNLKNPFLPGYFADPSIVEFEGKYYLYATADPWGEDFLSCWVSTDFKNWEFQKLNWPTKLACTSKLSNENKVWAPSVIKKNDKYYMYVSVGSEIWCGTANHPLGPWENMLQDRPLISYDTTRYYHVIDAEVFQDEDEKCYLYWGSGWDWKNGHCFVAELNTDMCTFKSSPKEVTPSNYFEGPFMIKHNGKYFLTYSDGKTIDDTYQVRYAIGDSPIGPFREAHNSPILKTDKNQNIFGPGHHSFIELNNKNYIIYHRHRLPFVTGTAFRQLCMNEVEFSSETPKIEKILTNPDLPLPIIGKSGIRYSPAVARTSSEKDKYTLARYAIDGDFSTRWEPNIKDKKPILDLLIPSVQELHTMEIRFEYPWKRYYFSAEYSSDGKNWKILKDYSNDGIDGSPVIIPLNVKSGQVRLKFVTNKNIATPSIWDVFFK